MDKSRMIEAVIFDIDGTLVDSVDLHAEAWRAAFKKFGKTIPFMEVRRQIGKGADQLLPVFWSAPELAKFGNALDEYRGELYKREYLPHVTAFPRVRELFERLRQDGKRIALASSAKGNELETYKRVARIDDLVKAETSSDDADKSKPHPDIFEAAIEKLDGVDPDRALVVGDTPYDAEAAAKAGLRTIGVLCGGWSEKDLAKAGCIAVYQDPADLLANYDTSPLTS
jgi:HAD superfamily hydrolase (TIGR01509 family)